MHATRIAILSIATVGVAIVAAACRDSSSAAPTEARAVRTASPAGSLSGMNATGGAHASVAIPAPGGFTPQLLSRNSFVDDIDMKFKVKMGEATMIAHVSEPSDAVFGRITIQPGGALPWHTHPGPVIVSVASGSLTVVRAEGCAVHEYPAGTGLVDLGNGMIHVAFNGGSTETVLYAAYLAVPRGQPTLQPVPNPGC